MTTTELTLGQKRVGLNFNPNENPIVAQTKGLYAAEIDRLEAMRAPNMPELNRIISRAQTHAEDACMLAVRAVFQNF
jgi:hypothetical protein